MQKTGNPNIKHVSKAQDEAEHSLEMQYPFIKLIAPEAAIVPFLAGEHPAVEVLKPFLNKPETLFVISSDFCHYGTRFGCTPRFALPGAIWGQIREQDLLGFNCIRSASVAEFSSYLRKTQNTICGRNSIIAAMALFQETSHAWQLLHYEQSDKVEKPTGSSVSYLAAVLC